MRHLSSSLPALCLFLAPVCVAGENSNASALTVRTGTTVEISLPSNGTTGYSWQLAKPLEQDCPVGVELLPETAVPTDEEPPRCGAPGHTRVVLKGLRPGTATIRLHYMRPWEKNRPAARTRTIVVTVK